MYKTFEVRNFRCFEKLSITDLQQINLISGPNAVGKTSLLEALFLHCGAYNPELSIRLNSFRGIGLIGVDFRNNSEILWDSIFTNFDTSKQIEMTGTDERKSRRLVKLKSLEPKELKKISHTIIPKDIDNVKDKPVSTPVVSGVLSLDYEDSGRKGKHQMIITQDGMHLQPIASPPPFDTFFLSSRTRAPVLEDPKRFGNLERNKKQDVLLDPLRIIEPRLTRLAVAMVGDIPMIHGDIGLARLVPLALMGEGMVRLASLILAIANAPKGVVLIDEIENGLYYSILPKVWQSIAKAAQQFNTQVFATTHSLGCITAAHQVFNNSKVYNFGLHRLERTKGVIRVATYDKESLTAAIEAGLEVR